MVVYVLEDEAAGWRADVGGDKRGCNLLMFQNQIFGARNFLVNHIKMIGFIMFIQVK